MNTPVAPVAPVVLVAPGGPIALKVPVVRSRRRVGGCGADDGFVTVVVAGLLLVLVCLGGVGASLEAVAVARHRAAAAADLSALAGARHRLEGQQQACAAAVRVARAQGARLEDCVLDGEVVTVTAVVRPPGPVGRLGVARSRARAGPVSATGGG